LKALRIWLVPGVAVALFVVVYSLNANEAVFLVLNRIGPATSDWLWANVTVLGDTLVAFTLCLPLWRRRPDLVWAFVAVALLGTAWARGLKPLVDEARPLAVLDGAVHVIGPPRTAVGFPSGHATAAFAIAGLWALGMRSRTLAACAISLATLGSLARVVVGVHWPIDILAGAFGGWLAAAAGLALGQRTARFGRHPAVQWGVGLFLVLCAVLLVLGMPRREYADAVFFERALGLACLAAAGIALWRDARLGHAGLGRHPGL
jgi:membrane-associated phospholipid phosphatase